MNPIGSQKTSLPPGFSNAQHIKIEENQAAIMIARDIVRRHTLASGDQNAEVIATIVRNVCIRLLHFGDALADEVATEAVIMCQV